MDFDNGALLFWETAKEYLEMHFYKSKSGSMPYNSAPNDMIGYVGYAYIHVYPSFKGTKEALTQFMLDDFWKISKQEAIQIAFRKCVWSIGEGFDANLEGTPVPEETILEAKRSIWKNLGLPLQPEQKTQNTPEATSVRETPVPVRTDYTPTLRFQDSEPTPEPKSKKEGCYIATAVYGSYDAPEVMTLRRFRDEVLARSLPGRMFIKVYYTLSPSIAKRLRNARHLNNTVRIILDKWVEKLEKKQH